MSKNDAVIKELLAKLEGLKDGLGAKPRGTWVTNGIFKTSPNDFININAISDFSKLVSALGFLIFQEEAFNNGCEALGIKEKFTWDGYTRAEWEEDFRMRISIVEYDNKKKTLDATMTKLNSLISSDARTEMALEDIKKLLG